MGTLLLGSGLVLLLFAVISPLNIIVYGSTGLILIIIGIVLQVKGRKK